VPAFVLVQLLGAATAIAAIRALYAGVTAQVAAEVIVPHGEAPGTADFSTSRSQR
jgi:hypothetical protein